MRIETEVKLDYADVLFKPKRSTMGSRNEVDLHRKFTFRNVDSGFSGIPIMAANMDGVGTFDVATKLCSLSMFTCLLKDYPANEIAEYFVTRPTRVDHVAMTIGILDKDLEKYQEVSDRVDLRYVCIDVANGYSERFIDFVAKFRDNNPNVVIIAGNVVTPDITEELILRGADIVKVGIGPGSVCTTRIKTGVGYPQLSAVIECADAAHGLGGHIIADGGCSSPGDVAKAFGAGADFVMLGGMFAGCDEGGGEVENGFVKFYGMSSNEAQKNHGGTRNYRASEGRVVKIPHKGPIDKVVDEILGGLRSTCTYVGAKTLKALSKCTTFIRVNNAKQYNTVFEQNTIGD